MCEQCNLHLKINPLRNNSKYCENCGGELIIKIKKGIHCSECGQKLKREYKVCPNDTSEKEDIISKLLSIIFFRYHTSYFLKYIK